MPRFQNSFNRDSIPASSKPGAAGTAIYIQSIYFLRGVTGPTHGTTNVIDFSIIYHQLAGFPRIHCNTILIIHPFDTATQGNIPAGQFRRIQRNGGVTGRIGNTDAGAAVAVDAAGKGAGVGSRQNMQRDFIHHQNAGGQSAAPEHTVPREFQVNGSSSADFHHGSTCVEFTGIVLYRHQIAYFDLRVAIDINF